MQFDNRGQIISKSQANPVLRTIKKVLHVDSADRDTLLYYTNGEFVVYLPRTYEKVVSIRLMSAEFPTLDYAVTHSYSGGQNIPGANFTTSDTVQTAPLPTYFMVELDGLNKTDETSVGANRSQYADAFFAKIPAFITQRSEVTTAGSNGYMIEYNDHSGQENIAKYSPPIAKLDRLRVRTRLHSQQGSQGFLYWTNDKNKAVSSNVNVNNYSLTLEIEYMDNGFDNFSSMQTFLRDRPDST
jgi:hypothetical protein